MIDIIKAVINLNKIKEKVANKNQYITWYFYQTMESIVVKT